MYPTQGKTFVPSGKTEKSSHGMIAQQSWDFLKESYGWLNFSLKTHLKLMPYDISYVHCLNAGHLKVTWKMCGTIYTSLLYLMSTQCIKSKHRSNATSQLRQTSKLLSHSLVICWKWIDHFWSWCTPLECSTISKNCPSASIYNQLSTYRVFFHWYPP